VLHDLKKDAGELSKTRVFYSYYFQTVLPLTARKCCNKVLVRENKAH
jgi:hypothetical protein